MRVVQTDARTSPRVNRRKKVSAEALGEFPLLLLIAIVAAALTLIDAPVFLRIIFGLPFALVIPGYCVTATLFPSRDAIDGIERLALSITLSLAIISLVALGVDYSPWSISQVPILLGLLGITLLGSTTAIVQRGRVPAENRPLLRWQRHSAFRFPEDRSTRIAIAFTCSALFLLTAGGALVLSSRFHGDPMTEFTLYNEAGRADSYPRQLVAGEPATVITVITNREHHMMEYTLRVVFESQELLKVTNIEVDSGGSWRQPIEFTVPSVEGDAPIVFELYRTDQASEDDPYRFLSLVITTDPADP